MGPLALLNHLFNLVLPALWLATLLLLAHRLIAWRHPVRLAWSREWLWLFGTGVAILLIGLILLQHDGEMLTYAALVLVMVAVQQWLRRRFRLVAPPVAQKAGDLPVAPWHQGDATRQ